MAENIFRYYPMMWRFGLWPNHLQTKFPNAILGRCLSGYEKMEMGPEICQSALEHFLSLAFLTSKDDIYFTMVKPDRTM